VLSSFQSSGYLSGLKGFVRCILLSKNFFSANTDYLREGKKVPSSPLLYATNLEAQYFSKVRIISKEL